MDIKETIATRVVRLFTFNKALSLIILVSVIIFGVLGYVLTPKQYNPEIIRPAFVVTVEYPGASAQEVEQFVTKELVEKVNDLPGVDEIVARSYDGGMSLVSVIFDVGEDIETAKVLLYSKLLQSVPLAQGNIQPPLIETISPDDVPIVTAAFYSDTLTQNDVRTQVVTIANQLKDVNDIANLTVHGGQPRALVVHIDLEAMRERNVSMTDVATSLARSNVKYLVGSIQNRQEIVTLEVNAVIQNVADAKKVVVVPGVELQDIAEIEDGWREQDSFVLIAHPGTETKNAVFLSAAKRPGSNAPSVSEDIRSEIDALLSLSQYAELSYEIVRDDGLVAKKEINGLGVNLLTSIGIVGLILVLFLSFRPAIVVMSAIPLTLLLVFFVTFFSDQTINRITLFALILSLGLLVDSATVVVENIYRHIKTGRNSQEAVVHAVEQVGMGLLLSTVTSVVVFLPVSHITGMMGPYMGPLAYFVPMALIMAFVVAFVIIPFLSYTLLHSGTAAEQKKEGVFSLLFKKLENFYAKLLRNILYTVRWQNVLIIGATGALIISMALPMFGLVHFQMLPNADKEQYYIYLDLPEGTDVVSTRTVAEAVVERVLADEHVTSAQLFVGESPVVDFNGMFKGVAMRTNKHNATIRVNLSDPDTREESSSQIVSLTRSEIYNHVLLPPGSTLRVLEDPPGPPVMATFVAKVFGMNDTVRERVTQIVREHIQKIEGVVDVDDSVVEAAPRLVIDIDEALAYEYGIKPADVAETLALLFGPVDITQYHAKNLNEYAPIEISLSRDMRMTPDALDRVSVRADNGSLVSLSSVVTYEWSRTIPERVTEGHNRVTYLTAETDQRSIVYVIIDTIRSLKEYVSEFGSVTDWSLWDMTFTTPQGEIYTIEWGGEWKMTLENFRDLGIAMVIALFLVYGILVAKYKSFRVPALVMTTVPFGLVGILPGFFVLDMTANIFLTATALIGFIALIGIVVNNAILYLEYFEEMKQRYPEMDDREALIRAGKVRLRPIMLTSLTTVLSSITIASDPVWSGLAWSIVFGLSLSTILTLVIFPTLYIKTQRTLSESIPQNK